MDDDDRRSEDHALMDDALINDALMDGLRTDDQRRAMDLEVDLLDPVVRADADLLARYLHPDFVEIGASGRRWDRSGIIDSLVASPLPNATSVSEMTARRIAEDLILVTYLASSPTQDVLRSSWWLREGEQLRIVFHQATPIVRR